MSEYGDTATRLRAPLVAGYGGAQRYDWAAAEQLVLDCIVQPAATTEATDRRQVTTTTWTLHAGPGADLLATDRVRWDGLDLEVDGQVQHWAIDGIPDHVEAALSLVAEQ